MEGRPECQITESKRKDIQGKKCQGILLDKTGENIVVVYEKSFPLYLRKWGLPKGKFKVGETNSECIHREVCEEVGIIIDDYPHVYETQTKGKVVNQIITFNKNEEQIPLIAGPEILYTQWVSLNWLKEDIENNPEKYNAPVKIAMEIIN